MRARRSGRHRPAPDGGATVVSAADAIYEGPGDLRVDRLTPGRPAMRWVGRRRLLLDHARGADGTLNILVASSGTSTSAWTVAAAG